MLPKFGYQVVSSETTGLGDIYENAGLAGTEKVALSSKKKSEQMQKGGTQALYAA